jgi:hypothetical protein
LFNFCHALISTGRHNFPLANQFPGSGSALKIVIAARALPVDPLRFNECALLLQFLHAPQMWRSIV